MIGTDWNGETARPHGDITRSSRTSANPASSCAITPTSPNNEQTKNSRLQDLQDCRDWAFGCCYYAVGLRSQPREEGFNPIQNSCQSRKSCNRLFLVFAVGLVNGAARFPAVIVWPIPPSKRSATRTVCGMPRVDCGDPRLPSAAPPFPPRARRFDPGHHGPPRAPVRPPSPSHRP